MIKTIISLHPGTAPSSLLCAASLPQPRQQTILREERQRQMLTRLMGTLTMNRYLRNLLVIIIFQCFCELAVFSTSIL